MYRGTFGHAEARRPGCTSLIFRCQNQLTGALGEDEIKYKRCIGACVYLRELLQSQ